jgi:hypothetical protein
MLIGLNAFMQIMHYRCGINFFQIFFLNLQQNISVSNFSKFQNKKKQLPKKLNGIERN